MKSKLIAALLLLSAVGAYADESSDDFGVWTEVSFEKELSKTLSFGLDAEMRTEQNSAKLDRWNLGASLSYKAHKYLTIGVGYVLLDYYNNEKFSNWDRTGWSPNPNDGSDTEVYRWGYTNTPRNWSVRHRLMLNLSTGFKVNKWLKLSVRERYQYTHKDAYSVERIKQHNKKTYTLDENEQWQFDSEEYSTKTETKDYAAENLHVLRSRLKLEVDKKKLDWSPFVSVEAFNDLAHSMTLDRVRLSVGTGYRITKHHRVSLAYVLNLDKNEYSSSMNDRLHVVSVGYEIKY